MRIRLDAVGTARKSGCNHVWRRLAILAAGLAILTSTGCAKSASAPADAPAVRSQPSGTLQTTARIVHQTALYTGPEPTAQKLGEREPGEAVTVVRVAGDRALVFE